MRIVSLLPSATEILCGLELRDQLVGVSHECDYPSDVSELPKVTHSQIPEHATSLEIDQLVREKLSHTRALYSLDKEAMEALQPDIIVTQTLCDVCAVERTEVERVASKLKSQPKIVNLEPARLIDLYSCILQIANALDEVDSALNGQNSENYAHKAQTYIDQLKARVNAVSKRTKALVARPKVVLLEWIDPLFSSGHWNPELVNLAGGLETIGIAGTRSKPISWPRLVDLAPEVLVIACCGYCIHRASQELSILTSNPLWNSLPCAKSNRVYVVDGSSYFNRPGPRLIDGLEILANALHPEFHPLPANLLPAVTIDRLLL